MERWTVCFDLDDTLMATAVRYRRASRRCAEIIQKVLGDKCVKDIKRILAMHEEIDKCMVEIKGYSTDRFPTSWVISYEVLAEIGSVRTDPKVARRLYNVASRFKYGPFKAFGGVKSVLRKLKHEGHSLHLITTGDDRLQWRKIMQTGLHPFFESINVTGTDKKRTMARIVAGHPETAVMIGDSKNHDIAPAKELGMTSIWVPSQTWSYTFSDVEPDHVVESFRDVPRLLAKLARRRRSRGAKKRTAKR